MSLEIVRLESDAIEVEVLPGAGARLHRLRAFGHDLLRTPDDPSTHLGDPFFWGSYVMAPWCNRVGAGVLAVGSRSVDLAPNFPDGTAIHGQVYARAWESLGDGAFRVVAGDGAWPWAYEVTQRLRLDGDALEIDLGLRNLSDEPMPAGIGIHPWFRRPVEVAINAASVYAWNTSSDPRREPVSGTYDLRRLAPMVAGLDATWTDIDEPPFELAWPDAGLRATLRTDRTASHVTAASPAELDAVAVEPQTHAPQGIRRLLRGEPGGLSWLARGAELPLRIQLSFRRPPP